MPAFGNKSISLLVTCHLEIQDVMRAAIKHGPDFGVVSGRRTLAQQAEKVKLGYSKTLQSAHVADPPALSNAIDVGPYIPEWGLIIGSAAQVEAISAKYGISKVGVEARIWKQYGLVAGWILHVATMMRVELRWGGDWDRDWNGIENNFEDLGHFERVN